MTDQEFRDLCVAGAYYQYANDANDSEVTGWHWQGMYLGRDVHQAWENLFHGVIR